MKRDPHINFHKDWKMVIVKQTLSIYVQSISPSIISIPHKWIQNFDCCQNMKVWNITIILTSFSGDDHNWTQRCVYACLQRNNGGEFFLLLLFCSELEFSLSWWSSSMWNTCLQRNDGGEFVFFCFAHNKNYPCPDDVETSSQVHQYETLNS